jgi:hypothetical protein
LYTDDLTPPTIRDNLDIGRPNRVALIFARQVRRNTPGVFRTRVITDTVTPSLHIDYKHCQIKRIWPTFRDRAGPGVSPDGMTASS